MGGFWEKDPKLENHGKCPRGCNYDLKIHESVFDHIEAEHMDYAWL
jgi:hypothetical protein